MSVEKASRKRYVTMPRVLAAGIVLTAGIYIDGLFGGGGKEQVNGTTEQAQLYKVIPTDLDQRAAAYSHIRNNVQCMSPENVGQKVIDFFGGETVTNRMRKSTCLSVEFTGINGKGPGTVETQVEAIDTGVTIAHKGKKTIIEIPGSDIKLKSGVIENLSRDVPNDGIGFDAELFGNGIPGPFDGKSAQDLTTANLITTANEYSDNVAQQECVQDGWSIIKRAMTKGWQEQYQTQYNKQAAHAKAEGKVEAPFNAANDVSLVIEGPVSFPPEYPNYPSGSSYNFHSNVLHGCQIASAKQFANDTLVGGREVTANS